MELINTERVNLILKEVTQWSSRRPEISAAALVGSWARGAARVDSDVDLMFLVTDPALFRQEKWINEISWSVTSAKVDGWKDKDHGVIWSRHVYLDNGVEVEFGFGLRSWASAEPIDSGTFRVVNDGCQVLYDPENLLRVLIDEVRSIREM